MHSRSRHLKRKHSRGNRRSNSRVAVLVGANQFPTSVVAFARAEKLGLSEEGYASAHVVVNIPERSVTRT
jgi:hypothetical protein